MRFAQVGSLTDDTTETFWESSDEVRKTPLVAPFVYKMHHLTKTGSGQT